MLTMTLFDSANTHSHSKPQGRARRRLDRYEILGEIASGGMATVFLARLAGAGGFQRFVAIKQLHPHLAREQDVVDMFLDEARLAASIHHPHVVPILEVGRAAATPGAPDGNFYLVMEYVEGGTVANLQKRALAGGTRVPRPVLLRIMLDALAGLQAAHDLTDSQGRTLNLVHRDCSPQNILVGVDGCSRLTDFGVARASSRLANTRSLRLKGKLAYMAPEQARGHEIDRRADVFAMGAVLWEMLSGRQLFCADNEAAVLLQVVVNPIPLLRDAVPDAPPSLEAVCAKALERDVSRRYQSAAELADALERAALEDANEASEASEANDKANDKQSGIASPREVAAYVRSLLGERITAQRKGVRALLQSQPGKNESSAPRVQDEEDDTVPLSREPDTASPEAMLSMQPPAMVLSAFPDGLPARRRPGRFAGGAILAVMFGGAVGIWTAFQSGPLASVDSASPASAGALGGPRGSWISRAESPSSVQPYGTGQPAASAAAPKPAAPKEPRKPAATKRPDDTVPGYMADPYR